MNKKERFVITINRELGSGGRTVGRLLAEKLGVPFFDKAVIKALQEKYNISPEEIERLKGRKHSWWADVERILKIDSGMSMDYYMPKKGDAPDLLTTEEMFKTETLILQDLAAEKSCVVAGRSGFHVFRDHPNHLSILIQASMESRIEQAVADFARQRGIPVVLLDSPARDGSPLASCPYFGTDNAAGRAMAGQVDAGRHQRQARPDQQQVCRHIHLGG